MKWCEALFCFEMFEWIFYNIIGVDVHLDVATVWAATKEEK